QGRMSSNGNHTNVRCNKPACNHSIDSATILECNGSGKGVGRLGRGAMFTNLNEQARECRLHALSCASKAEVQANPQLRQDFVQKQRRWLGLASSYEFSDRLELLAAVETKTVRQTIEFAAAS